MVSILEIIISNLIRNALKYNQHNHPVEVNWNPQNKSLSIKDHCIGIAEDDLKFIFNRFFRADSSRSSAIHGNGIGLYIVKKYCDFLSMPIEAKSTLGEGS